MSAGDGKPLNHPDYMIPGTRLLNFSKWSRENVPKEPPRFKVGDRVLVELDVCEVREDCDGTPLFVVGDLLMYQRHGIGALYGFSNESLTLAPVREEEER